MHFNAGAAQSGMTSIVKDIADSKILPWKIHFSLIVKQNWKNIISYYSATAFTWPFQNYIVFYQSAILLQSTIFS